MLSNSHFFVVKIKRNFFAVVFLVFAFCLLVFSKNNLPAVRNGLTLWATSVVPSLFPFFVATELLMRTNIVNFLGRFFNRFMKPFFNVDGKGSFGFIMGLISGYPMGAKIACDFRKNNVCSKVECERLLSFTNNSGPLFIIGTVGISMFGNSTIGLLLFVTHILACLSVGFVFRFWKASYESCDRYNGSNNSYDENVVTFSSLGEVMSESISNSIHTVLIIGGFVVIFSCVISILNASGLLASLSLILSPVFKACNLDVSFIFPFVTGLLEITNGINQICAIRVKNISVNIIFTAFLLGFGGISVLLQVWSIISKSDLSIKPYVYGKLLHGVLAGFYTFLALYLFPFLNFDLT